MNPVNESTTILTLARSIAMGTMTTKTWKRKREKTIGVSVVMIHHVDRVYGGCTKDDDIVDINMLCSVTMSAVEYANVNVLIHTDPMMIRLVFITVWCSIVD